MNGQGQTRNNGIFLGIILILFSIVLSYINPRMFLQLKSSLLIVPFMIVLIKNAFDLRKLNDNVSSISFLFWQGFICSSIAILMCTTFEYILFNYLYPELIELYRSISLESLEVSRDIYSDELYELSRKEIADNPNLYGITQIFVFFLIRLAVPGALLSMIIALLFRKNKSTLTHKKTNDGKSK